MWDFYYISIGEYSSRPYGKMHIKSADASRGFPCPLILSTSHGGPRSGFILWGDDLCGNGSFHFFLTLPCQFFFFFLKINKVMGKFFRNTSLVKENLLDSQSLQQNFPRVRSTDSALPPGLVIT